jgi:4-alpha-glucanotransferase
MTFVRASGILLHPTSLPGPHGSGDLGAAAYHFVDWLKLAGQTLWQVLPLGGVGPGYSPYMSSSAFAGNVQLIDLQDLVQRGWLQQSDLQDSAAFNSDHEGQSRIQFDKVVPWRMAKLECAARNFQAQAHSSAQQEFQIFCTQNVSWLDNYALFMSLSDALGTGDWSNWPKPLGLRDPAALQQAGTEHATRIHFWKFSQWCFFRQWRALKAYANQANIKIIGDAPIFVAHQSADVWAHHELFKLDSSGQPTVVAGVPPDYFSATGQRWGNPLYDWDAHQHQGFAWWVQRIRHSLEMVDILRIDHFRGFVDYWEIPASEPTAINGTWIKGPGGALFDAIRAALGEVPIIAEDLGLLTPEVEALRAQLAYPGMRILHFAFDGSAGNSYLPHNFEANTVAYTGTHDNNTTQGWWAELNETSRNQVRTYLSLRIDEEPDVHWRLIEACCASVAATAIYPMQDVLGLGAEARMNLPGVGEGHWAWRFSWDEVHDGHAPRLNELCKRFGRR